LSKNIDLTPPKLGGEEIIYTLERALIQVFDSKIKRERVQNLPGSYGYSDRGAGNKTTSLE
jgi:hypothetical protein